MRSKTFLVLGLAGMIGAAGMLAAPTQGAQTQDAPEAVEKMGRNMSPPRVTYSPPAEFSEEARAAKYQGTCILKLIVGADGNPRNIRVINPIGMGLDEKAVEAVRTWKFQPALKDGKPVAVEIAVEVDFHLFGGGPGIADLAKRANAGDAKAQLELANAYFQGKDTPKDEQMGLSYREKAAKQGLPRAQFEMAEHIIYQGASADYSKAYMWYTLASRGGYKHSEKALKDLAAKMTPEQLQAGQTLVDNWTNVPANSASPR
jgi:TonB family protein